MPKTKDNQALNNKTENGHSKNPPARLIFIGKNKFRLQAAKKFAKANQFEFSTYSEEEWATLEEIDQYIQEEELSKQIISLPVGNRTVGSLEDIEAKAIKKVVENTDGNMMKAARALKIARATLYRKMERYGLNLKKQREKYIKEQEDPLKRAA